jgi:hypothetical protein
MDASPRVTCDIVVKRICAFTSPGAAAYKSARRIASAGWFRTCLFAADRRALGGLNHIDGDV